MQTAIILSLVIITNFLCYKLLSKKNISSILALSLWFAVLIWYSIPGLICVLYPVREVNSPFFSTITKSDFLQAYLIESFGIILVLILVLAIRNKKYIDTSVFLNNFTQRQKYIFLLLFVVVSMLRAFLVKEANDFDYLAANSAELYDTGSFLSKSVVIFNSFLLSIVILIAVFENNKTIAVFVFMVIFIDSLPSLLSG